MDASPNALCFGEALPATGAPCHVGVEPTGLRIRFNGQSEELPESLVQFHDLSVSAGGLHHDHLVVTWGKEAVKRTLYVKDPAVITTFRANAPHELTRDLETVAAGVRRMRARHRMVWTAAAAAILSVGLFLWFGSDLLVDMAVSRIPIEWEQKLGETAYRDVLAQQTVIKGGPAVSAVEEMTGRLTSGLKDSPYQFEVTVVKNDAVNAFALPGGYVVVFTGLMKKAESGDEVAGVLSHELNHVLQRHGMERIVRQLGLFAALSIILGDRQGVAGLARQLSVELLTLRFSREQETEADVTGLRLLHRAKIDPDGIIRFFERLSEKDKDRIELLSTHPMSQARAARLKAESAALPKQVPEPFTFEWKTVQQSLPGS
ncbi:MAG TPA: M48 family metallopeptidase [Nitrospira sp.]|nr:M48 family metallopeptidase [Nitrospira sp.]